MFKKIIDAIKYSECNMLDYLKIIEQKINDNKNKDDAIKTLTKTVDRQSRLLDQFFNNAFENNNTELDTVVLIPYRGKPSVFKDGKKINTDKARSFDVNWSTDSKTEVNVYNE